MEVNIYEAKTKLSQLVERAVAGEEVSQAGLTFKAAASGRVTIQDSFELGDEIWEAT